MAAVVSTYSTAGEKIVAGFTLLELLLVLFIVAILAGIGLPSLHSFWQQLQTTTALNQQWQQLQFARSQAALHEQIVYYKWQARKWRIENDAGKIFRCGEFTRDISLRWQGGVGAREYVAFNASGFSQGQGSLYVYSKAICMGRFIINRTGRIRTTQC